jgi:class 3 adenylate cyclase/predicted ATPase
MQTVGQWLEQLGLVQYTEAFERNAVDLELVRELTDLDLEKLGVLALGHRKRLLRAISELNGTGSPAATLQRVLGQPPLEPSVGPEAERRQLTVLFCDLVGSTELSTKLDPEALRDLMQAYQRACREVIAHYEGHVAQYLGDGLMVYFGWPRAHEDDAGRAIRAGLEITQAVSKLKASTPIQTRAGIHTGLVVVGETGQGDASVPQAAVGETPNIAARLQSLAEPNSVVVSERTKALAAGLFDYTDLGTPALKGVSEPLQVFRVLGTRAVESRFEAARSEVGLTPLVGREEEIALLLRRWQDVEDGEGQVMLIGGEPGIGKSRLARVLRERLQDKPYTVLRYQCSPYHVHSALYPTIEQLERAAGFAREDTPEEKLDKMQAILAGSEEQIAQSAPLFAAMLSLPTDRYGALNLSPQKLKGQTLEALAGQVEALAKRQPVLMIWEDVHWIDATSQEGLDLLVPRLSKLGVLLIVTHRPEYSPRWREQAHVTLLGLTRLGKRQGAELVTKLTGGKSLPPEVLDQIVAHTDGVPLFVEELTKSILESKLLRDAGDRYVLDGPLPVLAIPTTLRDSLIARLDRLAPIREVAQIGACIGREFPYDLLSAVSPLKGARLDDALEQLTTSGLLFRRGAPPNASYTFKHALVQDAAYDSLLKRKRAQLHAQVAQTLEKDFADRVANEPEVLAHHFTQAELNDRAVPYWIQAGQRSQSRVAFAEAVAHLRAALNVAARLPLSLERDRQEVEIRTLLATAYISHLGYGAVEALRVLEPARELATRFGWSDTLRSILRSVWLYHEMRCDYPAALEGVAELDTLARSRGDSVALVTARCNEAHTRACMGDFKGVQRATDQLLSAYDFEKHRDIAAIDMSDPKCDALIWAGFWRWALGYPDQAREAADEQLKLARRLGHTLNLCWSLTGGTYALLLRGEAELARHWVAEADAISRENSIEFYIEDAIPSFHGFALIESGVYGEGYARAAQGLKHWRSTGGTMLVPFILQMLARALIALQRFKEAAACLQEALDVIDRTGHRSHESEVHRIRGELHQHGDTPDLPAAEQSFNRALEVARSQEAKGFELRIAMSLARLWRSQGKRGQAYDLLAPIYNWFTEGFGTRDLKEARNLLDELG